MSSGAVSEAVARVEAELGAFWSAATDEQGRQKARAVTMNFVAVAGAAELGGVRQIIEELAETRAGRVFLMTVDPRLAPWDLDPDVSAVCHKEGDSVVCYDRVELKFGAMAVVRAPSVLGALALSEVPTIVELARGAPSVLADALVRVADRVVVDSAQLSPARIAEIAKKTAAPLADRAFVRTFSWREMVARFFDDAPAAAAAVRRVEISRTRAGKQDPAALLLGWLASRLGWTFESATIARGKSGERIEIAAGEYEGSDLGPGELASVVLSTSLGGAPLELSCTRKPGARCVVWSRAGAIDERHEHPLGYRDEGWVLRKAIDSTESDRIYREAALLAADWSAR